MRFEDLLESSIIVCAGAGGTGKTTMSAAIALAAAKKGRKTIVVTIDPARRLADSLGMKELSNQPTRVKPARLKAAGLKSAPLFAMMLDTRSTFDELIERYAKSPARARKIIDNRFYQAISQSLSGTHEYMAMEKLYELSNEGSFDLIVIDTPPTRNALDFLEAPKRMTSFLEGKLLRWLVVPAMSSGRGFFRVANIAAVSFLKVLRRILGSRVLEDVAQFFTDFEGMYEGFKQRAAQVYEVLRKPTTSFVVVTAPGNEPIEEATFFAEQLQHHGLRFTALIVNRIHPRFAVASITKTGDPLVDALIDLGAGFEQVSRDEEQALEKLKGHIPPSRWVCIPYLTEEVADLGALDKVSGMIFGDSAPL